MAGPWRRAAGGSARPGRRLARAKDARVMQALMYFHIFEANSFAARGTLLRAAAADGLVTKLREGKR